MHRLASASTPCQQMTKSSTGQQINLGIGQATQYLAVRVHGARHGDAGYQNESKESQFWMWQVRHTQEARNRAQIRDW